MAVTRGPTTRRVAYTYDPETGNYSYGLQHPMKASPMRRPRGVDQVQSSIHAMGRGEPPARQGRCRKRWFARSRLIPFRLEPRHPWCPALPP